MNSKLPLALVSMCMFSGSYWKIIGKPVLAPNSARARLESARAACRTATLNSLSTARLISRSDAPNEEMVFLKQPSSTARTSSDMPSPPTTAQMS